MATISMKFADGVELLGPVTPAYSEILTPEAVSFLASLARRFEGTRQERLAARVQRQAEIDAGAVPDFPAGATGVWPPEGALGPDPKDPEDPRGQDPRPGGRQKESKALN